MKHIEAQTVAATPSRFHTPFRYFSLVFLLCQNVAVTFPVKVM